MIEAAQELFSKSSYSAGDFFVIARCTLMMRWKNHRDIVSLSKFLFASHRLEGPLGSQQCVHRGYGQTDTHFRNTTQNVKIEVNV